MVKFLNVEKLLRADADFVRKWSGFAIGGVASTVFVTQYSKIEETPKADSVVSPCRLTPCPRNGGKAIISSWASFGLFRLDLISQFIFIICETMCHRRQKRVAGNRNLVVRVGSHSEVKVVIKIKGGLMLCGRNLFGAADLLRLTS